MVHLEGGKAYGLEGLENHFSLALRVESAADQLLAGGRLAPCQGPAGENVTPQGKNGRLLSLLSLHTSLLKKSTNFCHKRKSKIR